jgi:hypothetical protein
MSVAQNSETFDHAGKVDANGGNADQLERLQTAGGHTDDRTQPSLRVFHRRFANPAPLGLLSFATGILYFRYNCNPFANVYRNFPDLHIWRPSTRSSNTQCSHWCPNFPWWSLPIYLWHNGICQRQYCK